MDRRRARIFAAAALAAAIVSGSLYGLAWFEGGSLAPRAPTSTPPPFWPGFNAVPSVYDAFDGYDLWVFPHGVTWTYSHGQWTNVSATAGMPAIGDGNYRLAYDATDGYVLLFGGDTSASVPVPLAETWKFVGGVWTNLTSTVVGAPGPRLLGLMTYDSEDHKVLMFGGTPVGQRNGTNDTWTYVAGAWTNATVPGPPPVGGSYVLPSLFYGLEDDPADGYVLFYEPIQFGCPGGCLPQAWGFEGGAWTNLTSGLGGFPRLSLFDAFNFDPAEHGIVAVAVCGTTVGSCTPTFGTFLYSHGTWTRMATSGSPPASYGSGSVYDPSDGGVMLVAGCCWADYSGLSLPWQDLWIFAHGTWTEERPWGGSPPPLWASDGFWLVPLLVLPTVALVLWPRPRAPSPRS